MLGHSYVGTLICWDTHMLGHSYVEDDISAEGKVFATAKRSLLKDLLSLHLVERVFLVAYAKGTQENLPSTLTESNLLVLLEEQLPQVEWVLKLWKQEFYDDENKTQPRKRRHSSLSSDKVHNEKANDDEMSDIRVRASIKLTGGWRSRLDEDKLRKLITSLFSSTVKGYRIVDDEANVTFNIICSDELVMLAVLLTPIPLSIRKYVNSFGLRSTVCAAMVLLASIQPGEIVLDPLCGVGALLLEAANICPHAFYVGMDIDQSQINKAMLNVEHYQEIAANTSIQLVRGDAQGIPLVHGTIDVILTDLPFGQKHRVPSSLSALYEQSCVEFNRLLSKQGRAVILTGKSMLSSLKAACSKARLFISSEHFVTLGRTEAYILHVHKCGKYELSSHLSTD
ncbi:THUMP domain-containing protein 2-like isoform X2 [Watersipora subatra]|uniref:THUMP domain-containing protein 2-like isoform X2 n=1 Tax=Watersipora subatra TaxID=2589382 RepID=UPI00355BDA40